MYRMYERVDSAVVICIRLDGLCLLMQSVATEVFLHIFTHNADNTCTFILQPDLELSS